MQIKTDDKGLIPAIAQDVQTGKVLMLAYMNAQSLKQTIETGKATYFSRSRNEIWVKGETSGHFQYVKEIRTDCDSDAILLKVEQVGSACHTLHESCFYRALLDGEWAEAEEQADASMLDRLYKTISDRKANPVEGSYTNYLFDKGIDKILKKVGEETAESIIAAKNKDRGELVYEVSDLMYHLLVLLANEDIPPKEIYKELKRRNERPRKEE